MTKAALKSETVGPWETLSAIRAQAPLVQNITNFVAMDLTANILLAVGASPTMARAPEEVGDFVALADALTINIGTLNASAVETMASAAREAINGGKPWVLDPVGAGATSFRLETAKRLSGLQPTVIHGNGGEILALGGGAKNQGRGVDSGVDSADALDAARDLAKRTGAAVAVTGPIDYVTDGRNILAVANGHPLMARVTAVGCALTALIGAGCAVTAEPLRAAANVLAILGVAGELAAEVAEGPGSFRVGLIDALYNLDEGTLTSSARIE